MSARKDGLPLAPGEKDGRPPAPDSSAPRDLESDLERLAVPHRSLFESDADVACEALLGTHRANPLSVFAEALKMASGLVALVAFGLAGDFFGGDAGALLTLALAAVGIFAVCLVLAFAIWRSRTWELMADGIRVCWGLGRGTVLAARPHHPLRPHPHRLDELYPGGAPLWAHGPRPRHGCRPLGG